jgi:hypothetical protein
MRPFKLEEVNTTYLLSKKPSVKEYELDTIKASV